MALSTGLVINLDLWLMVISINILFYKFKNFAGIFGIKTNVKLNSFFIAIISMLIFASSVDAAPRTPSQAFPQKFQRPSGLDYYEFKKRDNVIPERPRVEIQQQEDTGISIVPQTLIILAPKELQSIIDLEKYKRKVIGNAQTVKNLYQLALEVEQDFNSRGLPLVRVILPTQELEPEQATVFLKVIDGFIEQVDLSKVPKYQALRTYFYLKPLIRKKALTLEKIERQLLLAGNTAGLTLTSTLAPGETAGATKLVIEAEHQLISGGISFDNSQSKELARQQGQARTVINSPLGLGETISLFGLARPTIKGMKGTGHDVPIRAGGVSVSVPIGDNGLTAGVSYTESMTRPGGDIEELALEANMKTASATVSYPLIYQRNKALFARASVNWTDEVQHTSAGGTDEDISHDRLTVLRAGASFNGCALGCLGVDAEISKGLDIGSRSNSQVGDGTPLSRSTATSNFTHFRLSANYAVTVKEMLKVTEPMDDYVFRVNAGGQYTLNDLLNSEQSGITGEDRLSGFTSGAMAGDEAWYVRGQLNKNINIGNSIVFSPYVYSAAGVSYLNQPTSTERSTTAAKAVGFGLEVSGDDKFFFQKKISGKVELSKNWATSNLEDVSDARLNKRQMFVRLSMNF